MNHTCHAKNCTRVVPPSKLMCAKHWFLVPKNLQRAVWQHYRPGQETDKNPSAQYLDVMRQAIDAVAYKEGL